MTKNIRTILMPFLTISYVFGIRIANLSINHSKLWFSLLYMLLVWLLYYFLSTRSLTYSAHKSYPIEYHICYWLEMFINLLTIVFSIYHDKKFQNCLKKFDIVDSTLLELGTVTDYDKLHKKSLWLILGWFVVVVSMNSITALFVKRDCDILTSIILVFTRNYSFHINAIGDLTTATILGYIGLKFDQINKHLRYMTTNNDEMKVWENLTVIVYSHRHRFSKTMNSKHMMWIIIHLHLELRKISYEIDSIFGTQMSFKMACYFSWLVFDLHAFFYAILIDNYVKSDRIISAATNLLWFSHNVSKFFLINYVCETVSVKASATGNLINRLLYSTYDVEVREIISQFSLQMVYVPLRFCGIGFFQFGFKFLYKFIMSIATVLVILIQATANK